MNSNLLEENPTKTALFKTRIRRMRTRSRRIRRIRRDQRMRQTLRSRRIQFRLVCY